MTVSELVSRFSQSRRTPTGFIARCPAHDDKSPSLSISVGTDGRVLLKCFAGCPLQQILSSAGIRMMDLFPGGEVKSRTVRKVIDEAKIEAVYKYRDTDGTVLYENVRYKPKSFRQRRPDKKGGYIHNLIGIKRVPYRLPELLERMQHPNPEIWFTEGERDAENLALLGFSATSFKNWTPELNQFVQGCHAVILRDHDQPGVKQADEAAKFISEVARSAKVIDLFPNDPERGQDISDWIENRRVRGQSTEEIAEALAILADRHDLWVDNKLEPAQRRNEPFRLSFTTLEDLYNEPEESLEYVWENTLITGGLSLLTGKPKVGKSTLIRPLAVAISRGESMLGRSTTKGRVLYLCLEEKRSQVRKHFQSIGANGDSILLHSGSSPQSVSEAISTLRAAIEEYQPSIVFIDPLSRMLPASDFNDYRLTNQLALFVDLARETGVHICCVHHDGKGGREDSDAILGTTALFGAVDCHLQVKKRKNCRTISSVQRYGEDLPETIIELDKLTGRLIEKGDLGSSILDEVKAEVLSAIGSETLKQAEIKHSVPNRNGGQISRAIVALVEEGIISRIGTGKKNDPFHYARRTERV